MSERKPEANRPFAAMWLLIMGAERGLLPRRSESIEQARAEYEVACELLEALGGVAACFDNKGNFNPLFQDQHSEMLEKIDAAIANCRAAGKEPADQPPSQATD